MNSQLKPHETLAVLVLLVVVGGLSYHAYCLPSEVDVRRAKPCYLTPQEIIVHVEGAIGKPGKYRMKKGSTIQEILACAEVLVEADLTRLKLDAVVVKNRKLRVPFKKKKGSRNREK